MVIFNNEFWSEKFIDPFRSLLFSYSFQDLLDQNENKDYISRYLVVIACLTVLCEVLLFQHQPRLLYCFSDVTLVV